MTPESCIESQMHLCEALLRTWPNSPVAQWALGTWSLGVRLELLWLADLQIFHEDFDANTLDFSSGIPATPGRVSDIFLQLDSPVVQAGSSNAATKHSNGTGDDA